MDRAPPDITQGHLKEAARGLSQLLQAHRRQPLVMLTILLLAGIYCGYRAPLWYTPGLMLPLCAALLYKPARQPLFIMPALLLLLGWGVAALNKWQRLDEASTFKTLHLPQEFICRVGPEVTTTPLKGRACRHVFNATRLNAAEHHFQARHLPVRVTWFGTIEHGPQPGELWRMRGSGKLVQRRDGLTTLRFSSGEERSKRLAPASRGSWRVRAERTRRLAAKRAVLGIEDWGEIPHLNQAILLGSRHELSPAMRQLFVSSGTIHVFAISGLHIVLVAAVLSLLVSALGVTRTWWVVLIGPPLIFYTILTGARPSAVRACLMALLYFGAPLLGRRPNGMASLAGTALILHLARPWLIFDIGSILSFSVMAGLVLFCRPLCTLGRALWRTQKLREKINILQASGATGRATHLRLLLKALYWLSDSLAVSLAAFLASLPLTAHYFGRFTPGGILANLVIGPSAFMIVTAGLLGIATSFCSTFLATCFNNAAGFFTWLMIATARLTVALPGATSRITRWSPRLVWFWFIALVLLALWLRRKKNAPTGLKWLDP